MLVNALSDEVALWIGAGAFVCWRVYVYVRVCVCVCVRVSLRVILHEMNVWELRPLCFPKKTFCRNVSSLGGCGCGRYGLISFVGK